MTEIDTNYWYYTLSAVPQTLAATIALAATFSVVKLDYLSKKITDIRIDLRRFILLATSKEEKEIHDIESLKDEDFFTLYAKCFNELKPNEESLGLKEGMYARYQAEMHRIIDLEWHSGYPARSGRIFGFLKMKKDSFESLLSARNESLSLMMHSLTFAVFNIIISFIALPNYTYFTGSIRVVYAVVALSVLSMILTAWSVWRISKL